MKFKTERLGGSTLCNPIPKADSMEFAFVVCLYSSLLKIKIASRLTQSEFDKTSRRQVSC